MIWLVWKHSGFGLKWEPKLHNGRYSCQRPVKRTKIEQELMTFCGMQRSTCAKRCVKGITWAYRALYFRTQPYSKNQSEPKYSGCSIKASSKHHNHHLICILVKQRDELITARKICSIWNTMCRWRKRVNKSGQNSTYCKFGRWKQMPIWPQNRILILNLHKVIQNTEWTNQMQKHSFHVALFLNLSLSLPIQCFWYNASWKMHATLPRCNSVYALLWRDNGRDGVSNHWVREIHRRTANSPHKWPVTRKMFPFDDVIMIKIKWCLDR